MNPDDSIVASIRQITRAVERHSRHLLLTSGLTGPQLALMRALEGRPGACASDLAGLLQISMATVSGIVDRLEARGYVSRERSSGDRRRVEVRLTEAGAGVLARAPSLLQDSFRKRLMVLEEWEVLQILASLRRVAVLMSADDIDAAPILVSGPLEAAGPGVEVGTAGAVGGETAGDAGAWLQ